MTVTALDRALVAGDAGRVTGEQERPDPEVPQKARRRTLTAQYKLDVVAEPSTMRRRPVRVDSCTGDLACHKSPTRGHREHPDYSSTFETEARDPAHLRTWVVLVDGAEHQLNLIRAEAARRAVTIHIVIDLIHVLEYIWKAAWSLHEAGDPAAKDWGAARALAVLADGSVRVSEEITAQADPAGLSGSQRSGADACVRYLNTRHEYRRYDQTLPNGWPIATSVIEGACRT